MQYRMAELTGSTQVECSDMLKIVQILVKQ